jgi:hypothetical protein
MKKASVLSLLILGASILFMSVINTQVINAQEDTYKINQHQKEALKLFSYSQNKQQQEKIINDEMTLKSTILQKLQENQQQQEKIINDNDDQNIKLSNPKTVDTESQQLQEKIINDETTLKSTILQKLQENQQQQEKIINDNDDQNIKLSNPKTVDTESQQQQEKIKKQQIEQELLQKLEQEKQKLEKIIKDQNQPTNDNNIKAQSHRQLQQQQQIENDDQNIKALELFFNTDIQQQEIQK